MLVYVANYDYGLGRRMEAYADFAKVLKAIQEKADNHTKNKRLPYFLTLNAEFVASKQNDTWLLTMYKKHGSEQEKKKATVFGVVKMVEVK